jgi:hypothetical protein
MVSTARHIFDAAGKLVRQNTVIQPHQSICHRSGVIDESGPGCMLSEKSKTWYPFQATAAVTVDRNNTTCYLATATCYLLPVKFNQDKVRQGQTFAPGHP